MHFFPSYFFSLDSRFRLSVFCFYLPSLRGSFHTLYSSSYFLSDSSLFLFSWKGNPATVITSLDFHQISPFTSYPIPNLQGTCWWQYFFSLFLNSKYSECCLHNNDDQCIVLIIDPSPGDLNVTYVHKFINSLNFWMMWWISLFFFSVSEREVNREDRIWDYDHPEAWCRDNL